VARVRRTPWPQALHPLPHAFLVIPGPTARVVRAATRSKAVLHPRSEVDKKPERMRYGEGNEIFKEVTHAKYGWRERVGIYGK
jgi:hypothetical protein